jgi:hypothetical protein
MTDPKSKLTESVRRMKAVQDAVKKEAERIRNEKAEKAASEAASR